MKSFFNYSKNRILYNIFRIAFVFGMVFLISKCDVKAAEQDHSIDLLSFTYSGMFGDLNTGCSYGTQTKTISSNFSQYIDFYTGGYCDLIPEAMTLGINVTTPIQAGYYYTITERLFFNGAIQYLQDQVNVYTQCGIYNGTWNMGACDNVVVTSSAPSGGYVDIKVMFKALIPGTKYTITIGSLNKGYKFFYAVGNGGQFRLNNLVVESSPDPVLGAIGALGQQNSTIINQNDTIINQNETIVEQNKETNEKLDDINDTLTDETPPDVSALENTAGWLPAGPVDSILNLPFTLFNSLLANLGGSCAPVSIPIPFVDTTFELPCFDTLISNINGLSVWWSSVGVIAGAFILYKYFIHLYKWVDNVTSMNKNDNDWGGV